MNWRNWKTRFSSLGRRPVPSQSTFPQQNRKVFFTLFNRVTQKFLYRMPPTQQYMYAYNSCAIMCLRNSTRMIKNNEKKKFNYIFKTFHIYVWKKIVFLYCNAIFRDKTVQHRRHRFMTTLFTILQIYIYCIMWTRRSGKIVTSSKTNFIK